MSKKAYDFVLKIYDQIVRNNYCKSTFNLYITNHKESRSHSDMLTHSFQIESELKAYRRKQNLRKYRGKKNFKNSSAPSNLENKELSN